MPEPSFVTRAVAALALAGVVGCHRGPGGEPRLWVLLPGTTPPVTADVVLANAVVVTGSSEQPLADSVALAGGKILAVGPTALTLALAGPHTTVADLGGALVLPGLVDAHGHVASLGDSLATIDLVGTASYAEVVDRVVRAAAERHGWLVGRGWDQNDWDDPSLPDGAELERALPGRPVWLRRVDGHAALASPAALAAAGVDASTADPPGGRIVRRDGGREPTGVLVDRATDLVRRVVPEPEPAEQAARLTSALAAIARAGLTGIHDMGVSPATLAAYRDLDARDALPVRVYAALSADDDGLARELPRGPVVGERLTVRAVKLYADGALGSRGAALLEDYADEPGNRGLWVTEPGELEASIRASLDAGFQPCVHAIGDAAVRAVLDAFARHPGSASARPRIEHAQIVSAADVERFASLGVIASVQPTHATSDMPWAEARLGAERLGGAYAWRSLLAAGVRTAFGSDFPVERPDPLEGLFAAMARTDRDGAPRGGWRPEERVDFGEALAGFTTGAAWAGFVEDRRGTITPGADADLTVTTPEAADLARRRPGADPSTLLRARVLATLVGGSVAWVDAELAPKLTTAPRP